ncbi:MAG: hypothetical protein LBE92_10985 [Chryseobacterium sp.]|uniref:hypothetical protein n=1 Tax=Chryseobacterium sp. TaxID=1871047 RepID=UPI00282BADA4|nr:hypothetical protein [Chryseobacterium sp.]MDR2236639.1 hypothetical protein [Chryseobacterium sp.]
MIYIENGSDYHTYTFNIVRENAPESAPVENLLLSPLPDGTYREFLVTYYLTEKEKQSIRSGSGIPLKGKSEIIELAKGSFGNPLGKESCGYETVDVYIPCATGEHTADNVGSWGGCQWQKEGFAGPKHYSLVAYVCTGSPDDPGTSNPSPGSGSGGGGSGSSGGGGSSEPPCEVSPPLKPQLGLTDENGCPIGTPTLPNLPDPNNPCEKTKSILQNPKVKTNIEALEQKSKTIGEQFFLYKQDDTASDIIEGDEHSANLSGYKGYKGIYHNHTPNGVSMFSVRDIKTLYQIVALQMTPETVKNAFVGMIANEYHYILRYNGTMANTGSIANLSEEDIKTLKDDYERKHMKLKLISTNLNGTGYSADLNSKALEQLFFDALDKMNIDDNLVLLQRVEKNGKINTVNLNSDGTTSDTPCP